MNFFSNGGKVNRKELKQGGNWELFPYPFVPYPKWMVEGKLENKKCNQCGREYEYGVFSEPNFRKDSCSYHCAIKAGIIREKVFLK